MPLQARTILGWLVETMFRNGFSYARTSHSWEARSLLTPAISNEIQKGISLANFVNSSLTAGRQITAVCLTSRRSGVLSALPHRRSRTVFCEIAVASTISPPTLCRASPCGSKKVPDQQGWKQHSLSKKLTFAEIVGIVQGCSIAREEV